MAQPRNPHSQSSSSSEPPSGQPDPSVPAEGGAPPPQHSGDDAEISLDDYEERHQQRPRLPDQRRERPTFEMGATQAPLVNQPASRESRGSEAFESNPEAERSWEPVSEDEIAAYDPVTGGAPPLHPEAEELEAIAAARAEAPAAAVEPPVAEGLDDLEEFIARTTSTGPATDAPARVKRPLTLVEKVSFGVGGVIILILAGWLIRAATSEAGEGRMVSDPLPDLPMKGSLITIAEAESNWRKRSDTDRVAQMEVTLPSPGLEMPDIIPQVSFAIDPEESRDGYLRFIFKDSDGRPRGDTRVVHVKGGKISDLGQGEIIRSGTEASVYGSYGLINIHAYHSYTGNNEPRWSVEVAESQAYDAKDKDWTVLGTFDVRNDLDQ
jgi:hypothetical protein